MGLYDFTFYDLINRNADYYKEHQAWLEVDDQRRTPGRIHGGAQAGEKGLIHQAVGVAHAVDEADLIQGGAGAGWAELLFERRQQSRKEAPVGEEPRLVHEQAVGSEPQVGQDVHRGRRRLRLVHGCHPSMNS